MSTAKTVDVGIDLGTTYSVVAVKGDYSDRDPAAIYLREYDVTILPSALGEPTTPSVYWEDPATGEPVFGAEARAVAGSGGSPVMFSKRSIGTDEPLHVPGGTRTAKEVAARLLGHLKGEAERVLGGRVERAVVTHPAYFKPNQIQETREAAEQAGLDMALEEQMLMEPTAAALAYTIEDNRDPLRILAYDLGGGTFDVTVLERRDGVIGIVAFDGDPLLGGYNFDRALVQWLVKRVEATGRPVAYDEDDPEHRARRSRLLQVAEHAKHELARQTNDRLPITISAPGILVDGRGLPVQINERITRAEYAALIEESLERTVECCRRALRKGKVSAEELDAVVMVGGSTHGPWVREAVQRAFPSADVLHFHPDLCVAAGAAIRAANLHALLSGTDLQVVLDAPRTCVVPETSIAGTVLTSERTRVDEARRRDLRVFLERATGERTEPAALNDDGRFLFNDVALDEDGPTSLALVVADGGGERVREIFHVVYDPEAPESDVFNVLPKPIHVRVAGGLHLVADEGLSLPTPLVTVRLRRLFADDTVRIPIVQDDEEVGVVTITNVPSEAGEGAEVEVAVRVTERNGLVGKAVVRTPGGAVAAECDVAIGFPPTRIPTLSELRERFRTLEGRRLELLAVSNDAEHRVLLGGAGERSARQLEKLFDEMSPDKQEIHRGLRELESIVEPPDDDMSPPRSQFRRYLDACRALVARARGDFEVEAYERTVDKIEADGHAAYGERNARAWTLACESAARTYERLEALVQGPVDGGAAGGGGEPTTIEIKEHYRQRVARLRKMLDDERDKLAAGGSAERLRARYEMLEAAIKAMEAGVEQVDDEMPPSRAHALCSIALKPEEGVAKKIRFLEADTEALRER